MKKFEYFKYYYEGNILTSQLNELGDQGWELCAKDEMYFYFKREIIKVENKRPLMLSDNKAKELKDKLVIGDLCIFWDNTTSLAVVSVLKKISEDEEYPYIACTDIIYTNCTKYISKEQYLDFIK